MLNNSTSRNMSNVARKHEFPELYYKKYCFQPWGFERKIKTNARNNKRIERIDRYII